MATLAVPLTIGVTGHRDLRDEDREPLKTELRRIFADLHTLCPHTPLLCLTGLAEGADRLFAEVVLERQDSNPSEGVVLAAVLPLPPTEYEKDFTTPESVDEFRSLLGRSRVIQMGWATGVTAEAAALQGAARDEQYALAGRFIADRSLVLVGLWDGKDLPLKGGTAYVVKYKLRRKGLDDISNRPLDLNKGGLVKIIATPRRGSPAESIPAITTTDRYPQGVQPSDIKKQLKGILAHLTAYNQDAANLQAEPAWPADHRRSELFSRDSIAAMGGPEVQILAEHYVLADASALCFQGQWNEAWKGMLKLAFASVFFFELYAHVLQGHWTALAALLAYLCAVGAMGAQYLLIVRGAWQKKYLDNRALAEGLRVQTYWRLAGVEAPVADHYLRKQKSELDWIAFALDACYLDALSQRAPDMVAPGGEAAQFVARKWVEAQYDFFARAVGRKKVKIARFSGVMKGALILGVLLSASLFLGGVFGDWPACVSSLLLHGMIGGVGVSFGAAGLIKVYLEKMALQEEIHSYQRMLDIYEIARAELSDFLASGKLGQAREVLFELGREALAENGDWVLFHRERPVEVPVGK